MCTVAAEGKQFVVYLERVGVSAKINPESVSSANPGGVQDPWRVVVDESELKRPCSGAWVKRMGPAGHSILSVKCPGRSDVPTAVRP